MITNFLACACPRATALTATPTSNCLENFGQIQKMIFQRTKDDSNDYNIITIASTDPQLKATWDALKALADSGKVVISPTLGNPENEPGEPRTFGGGNQTPNGNPIILGQTGGQFSGLFYQQKQNIIEAMKALKCEEISVYFVNENGQISSTADSLTTPLTIRGHEIEPGTFFVGDKVFGGHEGVDYNPLQFNLKPNWSDTFYIVSPSDFNPLQEL